jgi:anti-anti-sigma factor
MGVGVERVGASGVESGHAPFETRLDAVGPAPLLWVQGEVDLSNCLELDAAIRRAENAEPAAIIIDLRDVTFMDSTGIGTLFDADSRARQAGRRLLLVRPREPVARVFRLTLLDDHFEFIEDLNAIDREV